MTTRRTPLHCLLALAAIVSLLSVLVLAVSPADAQTERRQQEPTRGDTQRDGRYEDRRGHRNSELTSSEVRRNGGRPASGLPVCAEVERRSLYENHNVYVPSPDVDNPGNLIFTREILFDRLTVWEQSDHLELDLSLPVHTWNNFPTAGFATTYADPSDWIVTPTGFDAHLRAFSRTGSFYYSTPYKIYRNHAFMMVETAFRVHDDATITVDVSELMAEELAGLPGGEVVMPEIQLLRWNAWNPSTGTFSIDPWFTPIDFSSMGQHSATLEPGLYVLAVALESERIIEQRPNGWPNDDHYYSDFTEVEMDWGVHYT